MKVEILTRGWLADSPTEPGDEPSFMLDGVLRIDGCLIENVMSIRVIVKAREFTRIVATLAPSEIDVKALDRDEWDALWKKAPALA